MTSPHSLDFDRIMRECYARVLGALLAKGFSVQVAEDALGVALQRLWEQKDSPPMRPEAWLTTVAFRLCLDAKRRSQRLVDLEAIEEPTQEMSSPDGPLAESDERLRVFFLATHPAIAPEIQTLLMLQIGCGLSVERISSLLLLPAETVSQRLVRAKRKIREAGISPELPSATEIPARLGSVLATLYALLLLAQDSPQSDESRSLGEEVLDLTRAVADLTPGEPETVGLLALACLMESRRWARRTPTGEFVPLAEQKVTRWDSALIEEGEAALREAAYQGNIGRYQLEAAIQSALVSERRMEVDRSAVLLRLYEELDRRFPSVSSRLGWIDALLRVEGPATAYRQLQGMSPPENYLPYWTLRGHLERQLGMTADATESLARAASLTSDSATRDFLLKPRPEAD